MSYEDELEFEIKSIQDELERKWNEHDEVLRMSDEDVMDYVKSLLEDVLAEKLKKS